MITVAHRVNTIVDSDMILGLENGKIVEYDTPQNLLSSNKSMFRRLVNKSLSWSDTSLFHYTLLREPRWKKIDLECIRFHVDRDRIQTESVM